MFKYPLAAWFVLSLFTFSGLCWTELRWKSDRELIEAAFRHEIKGGWSNTPAVGDVSAFLAEHPQCCSASGSDPMLETTILNALFFRRYYAVTIKYPVTDPAENQDEPFYESILIMDCCGDQIPDRYGIASSQPIPRGAPEPRGPRSKGPAY